MLERETQKRRCLFDLLGNNEVVCIVEARGAQEDLAQRLGSRRYCGLFLAPPTPGTSSAGGVVVAIRHKLVDGPRGYGK